LFSWGITINQDNTASCVIDKKTSPDNPFIEVMIFTEPFFAVLKKETRIFFNHEQRLKFPAATIYGLPSLPVT